MATKTWRGDAPAVPHIVTLTVGGTIEADDLFKITLNGKTLIVAAASTAAATVATNIANAWNAMSVTSYPEFSEITAAANAATVILTGDTPGTPFTVTVATTEANGGAADAQTFAMSVTQSATGPNDLNNAANWNGGLPANGDDVIFTNSKIDLIYNLDALSSVTLGSLTVTETFTGKIGLPRLNSGNSGSGSTPYFEYRPDYLKIGATTVDIRGGGGRIKIDTGTQATTINVNGTGAPIETNVPTLLWRSGTPSSGSNTINVNKGGLGVAFYDGESAALGVLRVGYLTNRAGDSNVYLGPGCTATTVLKTGGTLICNLASTVTQIDHYGGEMILQGTGAVTTLNVFGGQFRHRGLQDITTANLYDGGELDCSQDPRPKTIGILNAYEGATFRDPQKVVTVTNGLHFFGPISGQGARITAELGTVFTIVRS